MNSAWSRYCKLRVISHESPRALPYPHMQDALAELEDTLSDHLAAIETAADDDEADAEDSGEAERERRAYSPFRAA